MYFEAFYGNLDDGTGFDSDGANLVNPTNSTIGNRTDYVKLTKENGNSAYMICDFSQWESLAQHSKRDHCN